MSREKICLIIGAKEGGSAWVPGLADIAFIAGFEAAQAGYTVLTGGHSGVMEHALRGAKNVPDSRTIGILRHEDRATANPYCDVVLPTCLGVGRNVLTALAADVVIALKGSHGTLEELTFALDFGRPVLCWGAWENVLKEFGTPASCYVPLMGTHDVREWLAAHRGE